jgi:hypothetical protein
VSLTNHVALISESTNIDATTLAQVSAAIQKQVVRDFRPVWNVEATVDPFPTLEAVPPGYWTIGIRDDLEGTRGVKGAHYDEANQPFALVQYTDPATWSVMVSHECLEMLVDPSLNRLVSSTSIMDKSRVDYLLEVCDPCQDASFGYLVNGVRVSDFYTPSYFDPTISSVRYSFAGAITEPRQVLEGGYISWRDPESGDWWQGFRFNGNLSFGNRGPNNAALPMREFIDTIDPFARRRRTRRIRKPRDPLYANVRRASLARAVSLRRRVALLMERGIGDRVPT